MKWEKVKLGEVTDSCLGKMLDQVKNKGEYQFYLANVDVRWGEFNLQNLSKMRFEDYEQERYGLEYGDLVICEGGEPGRCAIWKNQIPNMKIQKALHRVRTHSCLNNVFLYYWFLLAGKNGLLEQYFTGSTIKHMPSQKLKEIVIDLPPIDIQNRIAFTLSAYDDLIENNQKQIKLLEEAAQRLYKEWFVDLRFPGHKDVEIVDGLPRGWSEKHLDEVYSIKYGKNLSTNDIDDYGKYPVYGANGVIGYYSECNCEQQVVLITSRGNGSGDVSKTFHNKSFVTNNSFVVKPMREYKYCKMAFTYQLLKTLDFRAIRTGSAQPQLTNQVISTVVVNLPSRELIIDYCNKVTVMEDTILELKKEIMLLKETRDRLLPKLMSGEVEV